MNIPAVRAVVTTLPGLDHPRYPSRALYMPHIVIGDPHQREAERSGMSLTEHYLGIETPKGDPAMLFAGVALIVVAMLLSAMARRRLPSGGAKRPLRGVIYSAIAGSLMGLFYPQLMRAISPKFNTGVIQPGMLTPYIALVCFGAGVLASNLVWNTVFMRA